MTLEELIARYEDIVVSGQEISEKDANILEFFRIGLELEMNWGKRSGMQL